MGVDVGTNAGRCARALGATIAMTGLNLALQTGQASAYHTAHRPDGGPDLSALMDETRASRPDGRDNDVGTAQPALDSTLDLVQRAKAGDAAALDRLLARCLPPLRRWASGRLPRSQRDLMDTDDLVQETAIRAVKRLSDFEPRHDGALQAYLRQAVMNRIRDEIRHAGRMPVVTELDDNARGREASPLEAAIGQEAVERYEAALARLRPDDREAIVARVEMDCSYEEVAQALGKPTAGAARVAISRALVRLAEEMNRVP